MSRIIVIIILVIIVAGLGSLIIRGPERSAEALPPGEVLANFMEQMIFAGSAEADADGPYAESAYNLLTSEAKNMVDDAEGPLSQKLSHFLGLTEIPVGYQIEPAQISAGTARIEIEYILTDENQTGLVSLVLTDGRWLIQDAEIFETTD